MPPSARARGRPHARAEEAGGSTEGLAKQAQNPIADLISVPFQNNINFGVGAARQDAERPQLPARHTVQDRRRLEPDHPHHHADHLPAVALQGRARGAHSDDPDFGLGDINPTAFFATSPRRDLMVGFGPTVTLPTAAAKDLGTGKWSAGPAAVAVWTPGHWVIGALVNNQWSFAGDNDRRQTSTRC